MEILDRVRELEKTEEELEGRIRRCGVKGYLVLDRGYYRYQKENGKRILLDPDTDAALIHSLIEKRYCEKMLSSVQNERKAWNAYLRIFQKIPYEQVYSSLSKERRKWIQPFQPAAEKFQKECKISQHLESYPKEIICSNGMAVRSKSESMIVSKLLEYRLLFDYERGVYLKPVGWVYPDFTILHPRTGKVILYEHFGRMDDPDYRNRTVRKLMLYPENGYRPGVNYIYTMETQKHPLTFPEIDEVIRTYFF